MLLNLFIGLVNSFPKLFFYQDNKQKDEFNCYQRRNLNKRELEKYICTICEYVYDPEQGDPENGIEPGTAFEDLPDDWVCPLCGVGKDEFEKAS